MKTAGRQAHWSLAAAAQGDHFLFAVGLATLCGLLWGVGILGRRAGVQGATRNDKVIRATCATCVYTMATMAAPTIEFVTLLFTKRELVSQTFADPVWTGKVPVIMICGLVSGLGGLLGTLGLAWSAGVNSALISMVENGSYTMWSAIFIAIRFKEHPGWHDYGAGALMLAGILLAQSTSHQDHKEEEEEALPTDAGSSAALRQGRPPAKDRSGWAVATALLAGACWGVGELGKKYGVDGAPEGREHAWAACTYFVYMLASPWVPLLRLFLEDAALRGQTLSDGQFRRMMVWTVTCGAASGLGGFFGTLAFAYAAGTSALISVIENSVFTVSGALLIVGVFQEVPTTMQLASAGLVVAGLIVAELYGKR